MRRGERASKRNSSQNIKPRGRRDRVAIPDRQIQRLVRAFSAIQSARLRTKIVSFAEAIALPRPLRRNRQKAN